MLGGSCSGGGKECIVCSEELMEHVGVYQYGRDLSVGMKTLQPINSVPGSDNYKITSGHRVAGGGAGSWRGGRQCLGGFLIM